RTNRRYGLYRHRLRRRLCGRVRHRKRHSGWTVGLGQAWPAASPDQSSPCVIHYLRMRIEEFLLEGCQVGVVQVKLKLQRLVGDPPVALEPGERLVEDGKKVSLHLPSSCRLRRLQSCAMV